MWLHKTGQSDPSQGGPGVVLRVLAGCQTVGSSHLSRENSGVGNGMSCKVRWDTDGRQTRHPAGLHGQFALVPENSSLPVLAPRVREVVVQGAVGWRRQDALGQLQ
eukprot:CAMPEP_0169430582 /NCGR_PEP_ID=MMETSP1042-20121227/2478_1 /TAXON_ID=464988 /ORGANISM="Hemiselmis andersenii, Strain CCMP1180" /LENGTH=105 /DNA_ID=CAMNT_0009540911 /DNA_START=1 /DNA_END=318 /DNA_ORIENTATION=+